MSSNFVFSGELLAGQINELNMQAEVDAISAEVKLLLNQIENGEVINSGLIARISQCIAILETAREELTAKATTTMRGKTVGALIAQGAQEGDAALVEAQAALREAQAMLNATKNKVSSLYTRRQIRIAILEGYSVVTLLREQVLNEPVHYKIMSLGRDNSGNNVLLEANPTLAQVLSTASLDTKTFSLRLTETQHQFNKILAGLDSSEQVISLRNTVLKQMQRVQLNPEQSDMWDLMHRIQDALSTIEGAYINYGQLAESFMEYYFTPPDDFEDSVEYIYNLLEKGRNNLAYYLGADIDAGSAGLWQIKALSTYGSRGRADVATLTNVLTPLRAIQNMLANIGVNGKQALADFFQPHSSTQGNRAFDSKLEEKIKKEIRAILNDFG